MWGSQNSADTTVAEPWTRTFSGLICPLSSPLLSYSTTPSFFNISPCPCVLLSSSVCLHGTTATCKVVLALPLAFKKHTTLHTFRSLFAMFQWQRREIGSGELAKSKKSLQRYLLPQTSLLNITRRNILVQTLASRICCHAFSKTAEIMLPPPTSSSLALGGVWQVLDRCWQ